MPDCFVRDVALRESSIFLFFNGTAHRLGRAMDGVQVYSFEGRVLVSLILDQGRARFIIDWVESDVQKKPLVIHV